MTRPRLLRCSACPRAGCWGGAANIDREFVCSVTTSPAHSRMPEGAAAWDWPAPARVEVERPGWTGAEETMVRSCGGGTQAPVVRVAFSADRRLALVTRSSFEGGAAPAPGPEIEETRELSGSVETCLLRLEKVLSTEQWQAMACKLDAVS